MVFSRDVAKMKHVPEAEMLDLVYDAAVQPDLWVQVMHRLADSIGATSGAMTQFDMVDGSGALVVSRLAPETVSEYVEHFATKNVLSVVPDAQTYLKDWRPAIITDQDWMSKSDLVASEYYNEFLAPRDIHSTVMIRLAAFGTDVSAISLNRPKTAHQFSPDDLAYAHALHPHLIRAFELGDKIARSRRTSSDLSQALEQSEHGIILVERGGRISFANPVAERLLAASDAIAGPGRMLTASHSEAARQLGLLIEQATMPLREARRGGSMAAPSPLRRLPLSITVAPLQAERVSVFEARPCALVCVTDLEAGISPPEHKLRSVFGLTSAEARVALALFEGATPREAAAALSVSFNTVRTQLARVFDKTGASRQADLVRLMMRTVGPGFN
jgi:DNA-binding CsgD family transcriptional regulator/PAS domain-containing protein